MEKETKKYPTRAGWKRRQYNCEFRYTDRHGQEKTGKGRKFVVDGVILELFPSPVLCGILGRQLRTLYGWEKNFGFPRSLWNVKEDTHCNRWYSRKQLIYIQTLYEQFGKLQRDHYPDLPKFIAAVRDQFYLLDEPTRQR